jgi:hypothetical protein
MDALASGLVQAIQLILSGDAALFEIIFLSLRVSGVALVISTLIGVPTGAALGLSRLRGRGLITALLYTGMGLPPVVVGLFVYLMLSRSGPLGVLGWLFTPSAMVAAQIIIAFPLVTGLTMTAVQGVDPAGPLARSDADTGDVGDLARSAHRRRRGHRRGIWQHHLRSRSRDAGRRRYRRPDARADDGHRAGHTHRRI